LPRAQGQCNSCWCFAAIAAAEAAWAMKNKTLVELSDQQVLDCTDGKKYPGTWGCVNGQPDGGIRYLVDNGAIENRLYPYIAKKQDVCNYYRFPKVANFSSITIVPRKDGLALKEAVSKGVVAVGVNIDSREWQFYRGGIFEGPCPGNPNHVIAVIGYGEENGKKYWILKNSNGRSWGEKGFMRLLRAEAKGEGMCGVTSLGFGIIAK